MGVECPTEWLLLGVRCPAVWHHLMLNRALYFDRALNSTFLEMHNANIFRNKV